MKTLSLDLDDELNAVLETVSAKQGRAKEDVARDALRRYVDVERLKNTLQDPALAALYGQLADEDLELAEQGMAEYHRYLEETDTHDPR